MNDKSFTINGKYNTKFGPNIELHGLYKTDKDEEGGNKMNYHLKDAEEMYQISAKNLEIIREKEEEHDRCKRRDINQNQLDQILIGLKHLSDEGKTFGACTVCNYYESNEASNCISEELKQILINKGYKIIGFKSECIIGTVPEFVDIIISFDQN